MRLFQIFVQRIKIQQVDFLKNTKSKKYLTN